MKFMSWGMYPKVDNIPLIFKNEQRLKELVRNYRNIIPFGNGRSYGDSALGENIVDTKSMNQILDFNEELGLIHIEAGVLLSDILEKCVPSGWFLKITPGTKLITIGGAIASDVHGKNHHIEGSFSESIEEFRIMLPKGEIVTCTKKETPDLWKATCGGMGLTGIILDAKIYLKKINSKFIDQTTIRTNNLKETFEAFEVYKDLPYSVAWIDCLAKDEKIGRCVLMAGEFKNDENLKYKPKKQIYIPLLYPEIMMKHWVMRLFNNMYYNAAKKGVSKQTVDIDTFFYPLDVAKEWNRIYGKAGFVQYQFIFPKNTSYQGLEKILKILSESGKGSFLAVLKLYGAANDNYLSFPMEGYSLALDFKIDDGIFDLLDELDKVVLEFKGRIYLTKDARVSKEVFEKGYPMIEKFRKFREDNQMNTVFQSLQSKRVGI